MVLAYPPRYDGSMDIETMLVELRAERDGVTQAILVLERMCPSGKAA